MITLRKDIVDDIVNKCEEVNLFNFFNEVKEKYNNLNPLISISNVVFVTQWREGAVFRNILMSNEDIANNISEEQLNMYWPEIAEICLSEYSKKK